ncbi:MAG: DUF3467 domain-containing protein [Nanoarchaeota archaeon]|nr:DUF3467 domain-containing protein [Nanoarchaeota archaeon]
MEQEKKINVSINEGSAFFAHEASINYSPAQFILDFRCVTPRVDPRSNDAPTINMHHNVVMVDPYHAKKIYDLLGKVLGKYEKDFGKIEKMKAAKIIEKKMKKQRENMSNEVKSVPNYFG